MAHHWTLSYGRKATIHHKISLHKPFTPWLGSFGDLLFCAPSSFAITTTIKLLNYCASIFSLLASFFSFSPFLISTRGTASSWSSCLPSVLPHSILVRDQQALKELLLSISPQEMSSFTGRWPVRTLALSKACSFPCV